MTPSPTTINKTMSMNRPWQQLPAPGPPTLQTSAFAVDNDHNNNNNGKLSNHQIYKSAADTAMQKERQRRLNAESSERSMDVAQLRIQLRQERNRTARIAAELEGLKAVMAASHNETELEGEVMVNRRIKVNQNERQVGIVDGVNDAVSRISSLHVQSRIVPMNVPNKVATTGASVTTTPKQKLGSRSSLSPIVDGIAETGDKNEQEEEEEEEEEGESEDEIDDSILVDLAAQSGRWDDDLDGT